MKQEENSSNAMEVIIRDTTGKEFIYWVKLEQMDEDSDEHEWSIERAIEFHTKTVGTKPAESDDDDEPSVIALEPFDRDPSEIVWI